jgi:hypothetical protein
LGIASIGRYLPFGAHILSYLVERIKGEHPLTIALGDIERQYASGHRRRRALASGEKRFRELVASVSAAEGSPAR